MKIKLSRSKQCAHCAVNDDVIKIHQVIDISDLRVAENRHPTDPFLWFNCVCGSTLVSEEPAEKIAYYEEQYLRTINSKSAKKAG